MPGARIGAEWAQDRYLCRFYLGVYGFGMKWATCITATDLLVDGHNLMVLVMYIPIPASLRWS